MKKRQGEDRIGIQQKRPSQCEPGDGLFYSTSAKTTLQALEQYRERNGVELYFDDEKNLLDLRRLKNHNEQTIKGKIFVTFISLIILARLQKNGIFGFKR